MQRKCMMKVEYLHQQTSFDNMKNLATNNDNNDNELMKKSYVHSSLKLL